MRASANGKGVPPKPRREYFGGMGRALSSRNYRFYASGHIVHVNGWWCNRIGLGWLTWELTGSAASLGLVALASMIPVMLVGPFAGALADRHGHRRIAMTAASLGAITTAILGLLTIAGYMTMPLLLTMTLIQGLLFGADFPARQALIPQLVDPKHIPSAVAFNATTFHLGAFIGPVLAGFLISQFGSGASILLFAATTFWMVGMVSMIRGVHPLPRTKDQSILSDLKEGFLYLGGHKSLRLLLCLTVSASLLVRPVYEMLPAFSASVFGRGAEGLATLTAAAGLGAFIAAIILLFRGRTQGLTRIMLVGAVIAPIALGLLVVTDDFPLGVVALALAAAMLLLTQVGSNSLLQNMARPDIRGRVISINSSLSVGGPALGALFAGWLADLVGIRPTVAGMAILSFTIVLLLLPLIRRQTSDMESHQVELDAGTISELEASEVRD